MSISSDSKTWKKNRDDGYWITITTYDILGGPIFVITFFLIVELWIIRWVRLREKWKRVQIDYYRMNHCSPVVIHTCDHLYWDCNHFLPSLPFLPYRSAVACNQSVHLTASPSLSVALIFWPIHFAGKYFCWTALRLVLTSVFHFLHLSKNNKIKATEQKMAMSYSLTSSSLASIDCLLLCSIIR